MYTSGMYTFFLIFIPLFVLLSDFPSIQCALAALIGLNYCALRNKDSFCSVHPEMSVVDKR